MWKGDGLEIVRGVFGDDRNPMRSIFPNDTEISCLPVHQRIDAHQEGCAQNEVRMHWYDTQRQIELHGRHLDVDVDELGARHAISIGYGECLATM